MGHQQIQICLFPWVLDLRYHLRMLVGRYIFESGAVEGANNQRIQFESCQHAHIIYEYRQRREMLTHYKTLKSEMNEGMVLMEIQM